MRYVLERLSEPEIEIVDTARMKRELGEFVDQTDRDDDIAAKVVAARDWIEEFTGRVMVDETWRLSLLPDVPMMVGDTVSGCNVRRAGYFSGTFRWEVTNEIALRLSPVLAITSVATVNADGSETALDTATYELREATSRWPRMVGLAGASWNSSTELRINLRAGYADRTGSPIQDASVVPERFKQAVILHVKAHYDDDADSEKLVKAAENMVRGLRVHNGFA